MPQVWRKKYRNIEHGARLRAYTHNHTHTHAHTHKQRDCWGGGIKIKTGICAQTRTQVQFGFAVTPYVIRTVLGSERETGKKRNELQKGKTWGSEERGYLKIDRGYC